MDSAPAMNDQDKAISDSEDTAVTAVDEPIEAAGGTSDQHEGKQDKSSAGGGQMLGLLALLVGLLAAAGAGYTWWQLEQRSGLDASIGSLRSDVLNHDTSLSELESSIRALATTGTQNDERVAALAERLDRQAQNLDGAGLRMSRLERQLDQIPGVADNARSAWMLAETEYYLRVANTQLELAGNADVALRALELADAKLADLEDPGLTRVRSLLADEITAVKAIPRPDAEGIVLRLASLERSLPKLPLAKEAPGQYAGDTPVQTQASGLERAWTAIVDALKSLVTVKRADDEILPLLTDQEESILLRSLSVDLQVARLALIRSEGSLYRQSLAAVDTRLRRFFDTGSAEVQGALDTLEQLAAADLPDAMPDISGSLALLLRLDTEAATP